MLPGIWIDEKFNFIELGARINNNNTVLLLDVQSGDPNFPKYGNKINLKKLLNILDECNIKLILNGSELNFYGMPLRRCILS